MRETGVAHCLQAGKRRATQVNYHMRRGLTRRNEPRVRPRRYAARAGRVLVLLGPFGHLGSLRLSRKGPGAHSDEHTGGAGRTPIRAASPQARLVCNKSTERYVIVLQTPLVHSHRYLRMEWHATIDPAWLQHTVSLALATGTQIAQSCASKTQSLKDLSLPLKTCKNTW